MINEKEKTVLIQNNCRNPVENFQPFWYYILEKGFKIFINKYNFKRE